MAGLTLLLMYVGCGTQPPLPANPSADEIRAPATRSHDRAIDLAALKDWEVNFPGESSQMIEALDIAPNGDIVLSGHFNGTMRVGATELRHQPRAINKFAARLRADGEPVWARQASDIYWNDIAANDTHALIVGWNPNGGGLVVQAFGPDGERAWSFDRKELQTSSTVVRTKDRWVVSAGFRGILNVDGRSSKDESGGWVAIELDDQGKLAGAFWLDGQSPDGTRLHVNPNGRMWVATNVGGAVVYARRPGSNEVLWEARREGVTIEAIAAAADGSVYITGQVGAQYLFAGHRPDPTPQRYIERLDAEGNSVARVEFTAGTGWADAALAATDDGVWIQGVFGGVLEIQGQKRRGSAPHTRYLAKLDSQLKLGHLEVLGDHVVGDAGPLHVRDGRLVLGGMCKGSSKSVTCDDATDAWVQSRKPPFDP